MTNRERYKQAFSALQTSGKISLEVEDMAKLQKKHKKNIASIVILCYTKSNKHRSHENYQECFHCERRKKWQIKIM